MEKHKELIEELKKEKPELSLFRWVSNYYYKNDYEYNTTSVRKLIESMTLEELKEIYSSINSGKKFETSNEISFWEEIRNFINEFITNSIRIIVLNNNLTEYIRYRVVENELGKIEYKDIYLSELDLEIKDYSGVVNYDNEKLLNIISNLKNENENLKEEKKILKKYADLILRHSGCLLNEIKEINKNGGAGSRKKVNEIIEKNITYKSNNADDGYEWWYELIPPDPEEFEEN